METQQKVSLKEFAEAMLKADRTFAERVSNFEQHFGTIDTNTLAVLTQAAYFCWHNCEYQDNLLELCRAIGTETPTSFYYHCQVTPERWNEINTYVVGIQRWLGVDLPLPGRVDRRKVERISQWLGQRDPAKDSLAKLFLFKIIDHLLNYVSLTKLGRGSTPDTTECLDFMLWYVRPDGAMYTTEHPVAPADGHPWFWKNERMHAFVEEHKQCVYERMNSSIQDAKKLVQEILRPSQPPCMHRYSRYLDIQLASIGVLKWRGYLPPDDIPKNRWQKFLDEANASIRTWLDGVSPKGEIAIILHKALGKITERSKTIVRDFLLADSRGDPGVSWNWLVPKAQKDRTTAYFVFKQ